MTKDDVSPNYFFEEETLGTTVGGSGIEDKAASSKDDKLGFKPYVDAVFSFLHNDLTKPPFTMSVEGEWGSGKSSFMLQLKEALQSKKEITVKFDAWRHDKVESMWAAFAVDFIEQLSKALPWYNRWRAYTKLYFKRFDFLRGLPSLLLKIGLSAFFIYLIIILSQGEKVIMIFKLFKEDPVPADLDMALKVLGKIGLFIFGMFLLKKVSEVVGNPLTIDLKKFMNTPDYASRLSFIESFHEDFDETLNVLAGKKEKIFVFIDDLDRAEIPKAAELMHGLNMMISNSEKLIFIIGMDREKVAAGVAAKYKDLLKFLNPDHASLETSPGIQQALNFGYSFLEKFIQLSFRVPSPSPASIKQFLASLNSTSGNELVQKSSEPIRPHFRVSIGEDSDKFKEIVILIAPFMDNNPRRLKQFINAFRLKVHIAFNTGLFQNDSEFSSLTLPQIGKFVAVLLRWPLIVDDLSQYPTLIRELVSKDSQYLIEEDSIAVKRWIFNERLVNLLKLKPSTEGDHSGYDLSNTNIKSLLETSPGISFASTNDRPREQSNEPYTPNKPPPYVPTEASNSGEEDFEEMLN